MKILILEDSPERIEKFKQLFKNQELFIFDNVKDAYESCLLNEFKVMMLDHDLDSRHWVDSNEENTGYQFIKKLIENNLQVDALCYIHSMNPVGANRMMNLLIDTGRDAIWIPAHLIIDYK
jgi:DNA-binding LacI/PurR family transcriptional regulator